MIDNQSHEVDSPHKSFFDNNTLNILVLGFGLLLTLFVIGRIWLINSLGYSEDAAGYAEIAGNLSQARGPEQDFIDYYFQRSAEITHKTKHWFSLYAVLMTPLFYFWGKSAFLVKIISTISYFVAGVLLFFLARAWFDDRIARMTSLIYYLHPTPLYLATQGLPDLLFACLFLLALLSFHHLGSKRIAIPVLGGSLALGFMTKPTFILLVFILVSTVMIFRKRKRILPLVMSISLALILLMPLFLFNVMTYQDLMPSDHTVLMSRIGYGDNIIDDHYAVIWDEDVDVLSLYWSRGLDALWHRFQMMVKSYLTHQYYAEGGLGLFRFILFPLGLVALIGFLFPLRLDIRFQGAAILLIWTIFFTLFFTPIDRYFLPVLFMVLMFGFHGLYCLIALMKDHSSSLFAVIRSGLGSTVVILVFIMVTLPTLRNFFIIQPYNPYDEMIFTDRTTLFPIYDDIVDLTAPEDVIMTLLPATIHYWTDRKTVPIPYENLETVREVIGYYNVDYLLDLYPRRIYTDGNILPGFGVVRIWYSDEGIPVVLYRLEIQTPDPEEIPSWARQRGFLFTLTH